MSKKTTTVHTPSAAERPASVADSANALEKLMSQIMALPESRIRTRISLDVPRAVSIASAAHSRVVALRPRIVAELPKTPLAYVDHLDDYAMAAWYAHLSAMPKPTSSLDALKTEVTGLRNDMLVAAEGLAYKGFFSKDTVAKIKEGSSHLDLANDAVALSALFTGGWSSVHDKTFVTWEQVERAGVIGPQMIVALGEKLAFGGAPTEAQKVRLRAVSLFLNVYDELDRAVRYLLWHEGEVAGVLPTLYGNRGGGRRAAEPDAPEADAALAPPTSGVDATSATPSTPE